MASSQWILLLSLVPYCLGGIAGPTVQSIVSNMVPNNEQGELQGALTSLISLASIIGPLLMTGVFYKFTNEQALIYFPGAPFFLGGILLIFAFVLAYFTLKRFNNLT